MKSSVRISTFDVASSNTTILLSLNIARAKHINCFCPAENISEAFEISVYNLFGKDYM